MRPGLPRVCGPHCRCHCCCPRPQPVVARPWRVPARPGGGGRGGGSSASLSWGALSGGRLWGEWGGRLLCLVLFLCRQPAWDLWLGERKRGEGGAQRVGKGLVWGVVGVGGGLWNKVAVQEQQPELFLFAPCGLFRGSRSPIPNHHPPPPPLHEHHHPQRERGRCFREAWRRGGPGPVGRAVAREGGLQREGMRALQPASHCPLHQPSAPQAPRPTALPPLPTPFPHMPARVQAVAVGARAGLCRGGGLSFPPPPHCPLMRRLR